jgi:F0F1-type ATP synthase assembly protein I
MIISFIIGFILGVIAGTLIFRNNAAKVEAAKDKGKALLDALKGK